MEPGVVCVMPSSIFSHPSFPSSSFYPKITPTTFRPLRPRLTYCARSMAILLLSASCLPPVCLRPSYDVHLHVSSAANRLWKKRKTPCNGRHDGPPACDHNGSGANYNYLSVGPQPPRRKDPTSIPRVCLQRKTGRVPDRPHRHRMGARCQTDHGPLAFSIAARLPAGRSFRLSRHAASRLMDDPAASLPLLSPRWRPSRITMVLHDMPPCVRPTASASYPCRHLEREMAYFVVCSTETTL
ncbi:hypothetical protein QBC45DRAFT_11167 [Copromyces sp. CBS 386.78]|nr:hypothetical protein QBC45DRAFT_11167 [Copromyces sp. CBS 386.78]